MQFLIFHAVNTIRPRTGVISYLQFADFSPTLEHNLLTPCTSASRMQAARRRDRRPPATLLWRSEGDLHGIHREFSSVGWRLASDVPALQSKPSAQRARARARARSRVMRAAAAAAAAATRSPLGDGWRESGCRWRCSPMPRVSALENRCVGR
jgi:hypothetical protein